MPGWSLGDEWTDSFPFMDRTTVLKTKLRRGVEKGLRAVLPQALQDPAITKLRKTWYRGTGRHCPCCGHDCRVFMPYGARLRPDAQCPSCNALERHRSLWLFLQERTNLFTDSLRVLHVAPEEMLSLRLNALPNLSYLSADLTSPRAMEHFDICQIPYPAETFDVILAIHVLEHIPDDRQALRELHRVLRVGGWAILNVPVEPGRDVTLEDPNICTPEARLRYYGQRDHLRLYGSDYTERVREAGFEVSVEDYVGTLPSGLAERSRLEHASIYVCSKTKAG